MYYATKADLLRYLSTKLPQYLAMRNINVSSGYFKCLNPNHNDVSSSMYYDAQKHEVHCCACGCTYDLWSLIAKDFNLNDGDLCFAKACELFAVTFDCNLGQWCDVEDIKKRSALKPNSPVSIIVPNAPAKNKVGGQLSVYFDECAIRVNDTSYLRRMELKPELAALYNIGYDPDFQKPNGNNGPAIIIPVAPDAYVALDIDSNSDLERYVVGSNHIFGDIVAGGQTVFINQNEFDTLILLANGYSAYTLANMSAIGELELCLQKHNLERVYLISSTEDEDPDLNNNICEYLVNKGINASLLDLSFPYGSVREFIQRGSDKFRKRLSELDEILKPHTKQLQLNRNVAKNIDREQFTELELEPAVYGVVAPACLRRSLLAHWLLATENRFIYCSSTGDWQIFGMLMSDRIKLYGSGYSSRLSKISLYELGADASYDAALILKCLLSQRIKMQKKCCLILNASGRTSSYLFELMRELCAGLRSYNVVVIVFDSGLKTRSLDEFCCSTIQLAQADNQDEDNPYESMAIKMKFIGPNGEASESYLSSEELV